MNINCFSKHIFWNYDADADIPDNIVTKHVFLYGETKDMINLISLVDELILIRVLNEIKKSKRFKKRVNFIEKVILAI